MPTWPWANGLLVDRVEHRITTPDGHPLRSILASFSDRGVASLPYFGKGNETFWFTVAPVPELLRFAIDDLRAWNAVHQIPILYVTHSHREVFALGDRVVVLERGHVIATGTPHDVLEMPEHPTLAQLAGFENVLPATVIHRKADVGTMQCRLAGTEAELEVPLARGATGTRVQIAVRAGDILLATEPPRGLSARNILVGKLVSLTRDGATMIAAVDAGARFVVHLTPSATQSLQLASGQRVWLVIKTYSCRSAA